MTLLVAVAVAAPRVTERSTALLQGERAPTLAECLQRIHVPCLGPAQVRAAYGVDALLRRGITGKGRTIAIIVSFGSPTIRSDLQAFDRAFGLPDPLRLDILAPLGMRHPASTGWVGETTLDVEWAHAIAPQARLVVLESPVDETEGDPGHARVPVPGALCREPSPGRRAVAKLGRPPRIPCSKGPPRHRGSVPPVLRHAARRGITAVTGSGDEGAGGYDLSVRRLYPYPAWVTRLRSAGPGRGGHAFCSIRVDGLIGETTWPGSGGGVSKFFAEPAYQQGQPAAIPAPAARETRHPHVAYNAALESPVLVYQGGHWSLTGGTSAGDAAVGRPDRPGRYPCRPRPWLRQHGALPPRRLAALPQRHTRHHHGGDLRPGARRERYLGTAFRAGVGWNAATGLGSPRAATSSPTSCRRAERK